MRFLKLFISIVTFFTIIIVFTDQAEARKKGGKAAFAGGSLSVGLGIAFSTAQQDGLNNMIAASKTASPGVSTGNLSSAMEYNLQFTFRFANNLAAIQLRPTLFQQEATGSGAEGAFNYKLDGFLVFPLVRIIPLSNDIIDFYMQFGLGYGKLNGEITNGTRNASFSGSNFGAQVGVGADFCFVPDHCFGVEGNYRYLPIQRNIVSSGTGPGNLPYGSSQANSGSELEGTDGNDVGTTFNGISGQLNYTYNF